MRLPISQLLLLLIVAGFSLPLLAVEKAPVVASKPEPEGFLLRYKFKPGELLHYKDSQTTTFLTSKADKREQSKQKAVYEKHLEVVSISKAGDFTLKPVLDHVKMSAQFNEAEPITYDSQTKKVPPKQFRGIDEAIGKPLGELKVSSAGELLEQKTFRLQDVAKPKTELVNAEKVKSTSRKNFLLEFPIEKIKVGETWKKYYFVQVNIPQSRRQLPVKFLRKHTLTKVENNIATIAIRTVQLTNITDPQLQVQLIQRSPVSTVNFDIERGIMLSRKTTIDAKVFAFAGANSVVKAESVREEVYVEKP